MRKTSAILFLAVLLFNFCGYKLMMRCIEDQQNVSFSSKLDRAEYNDADLVSIKTALNLPYYTSSPEFERAFGSVNVNGVVYEYVKRRVLNDTLELLCLPNHEKTNLQAAKNEFVKLGIDSQCSQPKKSSNTVKITLPDFPQEMNVLSLASHMEAAKAFSPANFNFIFADHSSRQERPPKSNA